MTTEPDADCHGEWRHCDKNCFKFYYHSATVSGLGQDCEFAHGHRDDCEPGVDECPQACTTEDDGLCDVPEYCPVGTDLKLVL